MNISLIRTIVILAATTGYLAIPSATFASIEFDQNVTNNAIFGSGNANGGFTTDRNASAGVELGLRAKLRFPTPMNLFNSNGDGTYSHSAGNSAGNALWNFEWSINSDFNGNGVNLDGLTYEIRMDFEPSQGTNFFSFDLINLAFADHSIGDNSTGQGAGVEATSVAQYAGLIANNNLAQNSWRLDFFDNPVSPFSFDPNIDATYTFQLAAFDSTGGPIAQTSIDVIVGAGGAPVPEPGSLLILAGLFACAGVASRRQR